MAKGPTPAQLEWAGRVWDKALRCDCEAVYWLAFRYHSGAESFALFRWADLGEANQLEIAANLLRLENYFVRAHRCE